MIRCDDNYLYTGITANLRKRLVEHKSGRSRLTKDRGKINLVYFEEFDSRAAAAAREREIKGWRREKKEDLINKRRAQCD